MKIRFIFTGKTKFDYIDEGIQDYFSRLQHYINTEIKIIPDLKNTRNLSEEMQMKKEGELLLKELNPGELILLLDEKGKKFNSREFSGFLSKKMNEGRDVCMVVGGAYGFSDEIKQKSDVKISLSPMTFSHQMVRLILIEQVYRAFTILRREPYHHD